MYLKIMLINFQKRTLTTNNKIKMKIKKRYLHGKPGDVSEELNFTDTESDPSDRDDTDNLIKHPNVDDDMAYFDNTTVGFIQKLHFHVNVLDFVLF